MDETERVTKPEDITGRTIASFDGWQNERLRTLMRALVRHLHELALEVQLSPPEWEAAVAALTATGQITHDPRQEWTLWPDALGLSMRVALLCHHAPPP